MGVSLMGMGCRRHEEGKDHEDHRRQQAHDRPMEITRLARNCSCSRIMPSAGRDSSPESLVVGSEFRGPALHPTTGIVIGMVKIIEN
ncbi:hypothetical protein [Methylobacterium frigidaeris]|nr:hypothetical protein [Methylobacterium frigidaeris]